MPLGEAQALVDSHCERHDPHADQRALRQLAWWCQQFSPLVGLEESPFPASLFLDITGCAHLFGGEQAMAEHMAAVFARHDLQVRLASADTPGAAWAVSHYGIGSGEAVPPGRQGDVLHPLPIEALRLDGSVVAALRALDVRTIAQLRALPRATLPSRFGPELLWRLDQALGRVPEPLHPERPPEVIAAEWTADFALRSRQHIETVLRELLAQVAARVAARGQGVRQLLCIVQCEKRPVQMSLELLNASISVRHLFELVCLQLERRLIPGEVSRIQVRVTGSAPLTPHSVPLWESDSKQGRGKDVELLLERLGSRLGEDAVLRPRITPDAQPECLVNYQKVSGEWRVKNGESTQDSSLISHHSPLLRPLCVLPAPAGVEALSVAPEGPPIRFRWQKEEYTIRWSWGPERIETGWWRGDHVRRDYYRVETTCGRWFWLFRRRNDAHWFLHGVFE